MHDSKDFSALLRNDWWGESVGIDIDKLSVDVDFPKPVLGLGKFRPYKIHDPYPIAIGSEWR